jgi:hypothetical protein
VARKLLTIVNAVVRTGRSYDAEFAPLVLTGALRVIEGLMKKK